MFDSLRNLRKSDSEKRQEELTAYLDDALTPAERHRFEERLEADGTLRAELHQQQMVKQAIRQLPRARAPRNFTLSPAKYGRPRSRPSYALYPALRAATVVAAVFLIFAISADFLVNMDDQSLAMSPVTEGEQAPEFAAEPAEEIEAEVVVKEAEVDDVAPEQAAEESLLLESEELVEEEAEAPLEPMPESAEATPAAIPTAPSFAEIQPPAPAAGEAAADEATEEESAALATSDLGRALPATTVAADTAEEAIATATPGASSRIAEQPVFQETATSQDEASPSGISLLRIAEITLLIAVILLAAATLVFRSRL